MDTDRLEAAQRVSKDVALQGELLQTAAKRQGERLRETINQDAAKIGAGVSRVMSDMAALSSPMAFMNAWAEYVRDASERAAMTADTLRQTSDNHTAHREAGSPPVLIYDYDIIMDGAHQPRPTNYLLLEIRPPEGYTIDPSLRPCIIIDPRAGHGGGIGGFKEDSQVGVALSHGNPVYFVAFRPDPVPGQTLADVCETEAAFVAEVERRHPDSEKPIVVGNCPARWRPSKTEAWPPVSSVLALRSIMVAARWKSRELSELPPHSRPWSPSNP